MRDLRLYRNSTVGDETKIRDTIPNMDDSVSIRPQLAISEKEIDTRYGIVIHCTTFIALTPWL